MRKPYFRKSRDRWYVQFNGRDVNLGKDRAEAMKKWHAMMAGQHTPKARMTVKKLALEFLTWTKANKAVSTYKWYRHFLKSFCRHHPGLMVADLKPMHVARWLDATKYIDNTGNCAVRCVSRCFNWAAEMGVIPENPIKGIKRPSAQGRECNLTDAQWDKVVESCSDEFRDYLIVLRETGCRPQEIRAVEARHVVRDGWTWTFPVSESKGKRRARVVVLNEQARAITQRLMLKYPSGPLFRNTNGKPWTKSSINCRFRRLSKRLGFRVFAYMARHLFCTSALMNGVEVATVATLMGHSDLKMVWQIYNKLRLQAGHLKSAAELATKREVG